jgi:hypothetical protein
MSSPTMGKSYLALLFTSLIEFMYSYPLGEKKAKDSDILVYFEKETMNLKEVKVRANSINITNTLVLHAVQPITEVYFDKNDLDFKNIECLKATPEDQQKLNHYVERILDIIFNT